jgi:hypothetical protein
LNSDWKTKTSFKESRKRVDWIDCLGTMIGVLRMSMDLRK